MRKALVIEPEDDMLTTMQKCLQSGDYAVDAYGSGAEALSAVKDSLYDLIILDVSNPTLGAEKIVEAARENNPDTRILGMSTYGQDLAGANGTLYKPFSWDDLTSALRFCFPE